MSLSLFERDPKATLLLMLATVTITLGFVNLILTVIVDQAAEAKASDIHQVAVEKLGKKAEARDTLLKLCEKVDKNCNGTLDIDELLRAYERSAEFHSVMTVMDITEVELRAVFEFADQKGTGEIDYITFCDAVFEMTTCNPQMIFAMVKLNLQATSAKVSVMTPQIEALTQQTTMCMMQLGTLSSKIDKLMVHTGAPSANVSKGERSLQSNIAHHIDACDPLDKIDGDVGVESPRDLEISEKQPKHNMSANVLGMQTVSEQAREKIDSLQRDVQMMMSRDSYLWNRSMAPVASSLTQSIAALMGGEGTADEHDVETLKVWMVEKKFQQCKAELDMLSQFIKAKPSAEQFGEEQDMSESQGGQKIASTQRQVLSQLVGLLPLLLPSEVFAVTSARSSYL